MKKGLRLVLPVMRRTAFRPNARPDEEGIKTFQVLAHLRDADAVRTPALMKKGLRPTAKCHCRRAVRGPNARPDEEGIKTQVRGIMTPQVRRSERPP